MYNKDNSVLEQLNRDLDEIHRYYEAKGFILIKTETRPDGNLEYWKTTTDKTGHTFTILPTQKGYKIRGWSSTHSCEAGTEPGVKRKFADCVMTLESITAKELTLQYAGKYANGQRKGKDNSHSSLRSQQPPAKPEPPEKPRFAFPRELKLDEDALLLPDGRELKQDQLLPTVYTGSTGGELIENIAFLYERPSSLVYRIKYENGVKDIRQYSFNAQTGLFTMGGVDNQNRRLFNEQAAYSAEVVFYCEGEKCAFQLQRYFLERKIDNVAVVTAGGCGNINPDVIREALGGKSVFILPDNDDGGYKCAFAVKTALLGTGATVQVFQWNDSTAEKYDIADFLADRAEPLTSVVDLSSFLRSLEDAGGWTDGGFLTDREKKADEPAEAVDDEDVEETLAELYEDDPQLPPFLIPDLIRENDSVILIAAAGVGKTWFSASLAYAVATGTKFLDRFEANGVKKNVYFVNPEMTRASLKERFKTFTKEKIDNLRFLHWDIVRKKMKQHPSIELSDDFWLNFLEKKIQKFKIDLLVIDSFLMCYHPKGTNANAAEFAENFNDLMLMCRNNNCTMFTVLHDGKDPTKEGRGTSALLDMPELSIKLSKPAKTYSNGKEVEFDFSIGKKNRNGISETSFSARRDRFANRWITENAADRREFEQKELDEKTAFVRKLVRDGITYEKLSSPQYAELVPKKGLSTLYEEYLIEFIVEQRNIHDVPVKDLLEQYEKPLVRKAVFSLYPNDYGAACAILFEAGDNPTMIKRAFQAIRPGAEEPKELREAIDAKQAENNRRLKETCLKAFDNGQRIDELRKKFGKKVAVKLLNTYFSEWSEEQARKLLDNGVDVADIIADKLEDNRIKYDHVAVAGAYIDRNDDKIVALNELIALDAIDRKRLKEVAKSFGLSMPDGRRKKEAETDPSTTSTAATA